MTELDCYCKQIKFDANYLGLINRVSSQANSNFVLSFLVILHASPNLYVEKCDLNLHKCKHYRATCHHKCQSTVRHNEKARKMTKTDKDTEKLGRVE